MNTIRLLGITLTTMLLASFDARADIFIFDDLTNMASVEQLPDSPGAALKDVITPLPGEPLCTSPTECDFFITSTDGLNPGTVYETLGFGNPATGFAKDLMVFYGNPESAFGSRYIISMGADANFNPCFVPAVCSAVLSETGGVLQTVATLPWVDSNGDVVRYDTIEFLPADVPEPRWSLLASLLVLLSMRVFRRSN